MSLATQGRRGKLEKTIEVQTDDPVTPKLTLKVGGEVEAIAALDPAWMNLGPVPVGTPRNFRVKVIAKDPEKFQAVEITASDDRLSAKFVRDAQGPALDVTMKPIAQVGPYRGNLTVKTNLAQPATLSLSISAQVSQDLVVEPPSFMLPQFDPRNPIVPRRAQVRSLGGKPFKLLKVEDPQGIFEGRVDPMPGGWMVELKPKKAPERPSGVVRILTDRADQKTLELSWTGPMASPSRDVTRRTIDTRRPPVGPAVRALAPAPAAPARK